MEMSAMDEGVHAEDIADRLAQRLAARSENWARNAREVKAEPLSVPSVSWPGAIARSAGALE